jgi:hypothetical protein
MYSLITHVDVGKMYYDYAPEIRMRIDEPSNSNDSY